VTQPNEPAAVTLEKAWAKLMRNMGGTNLQRARDARKAANRLAQLRGRH
jgi:hypothetical protein